MSKKDGFIPAPTEEQRALAARRAHVELVEQDDPSDPPPLKPKCHKRRRYYADDMCEKCYWASRGARTPDIARQVELTELHKVVAHLEFLRQSALAIITQRLPDYAALHFEGAVRAAREGDTRPTEWALTHIKAAKDIAPVADPPAKSGPADTGVRVFIGVNLPTTPGGEMSSDIPTVEAKIVSNG